MPAPSVATIEQHGQLALCREGRQTITVSAGTGPTTAQPITLRLTNGSLDCCLYMSLSMAEVFKVALRVALEEQRAMQAAPVEEAA